MIQKSKIVLFMAAMVAVSCGKDGFRPCIRGNGDISTDTRSLPEFEGVDYRLTGKVHITAGTVYEASIRGHANHLEKVRTRIQEGILIIDSDRCLKNEDFQVDITLPHLNHLQIQGAADAEVDGGFTGEALYIGLSGSGTITVPVDASEVSARISGSGAISLRGTSSKFLAEISGSGKIQAFDLQTQHLDAKISGSGDIESTVRERIDAAISGSGSIRYKGEPTSVNSTVSGSGKVVHVN